MLRNLFVSVTQYKINTHGEALNTSTIQQGNCYSHVPSQKLWKRPGEVEVSIVSIPVLRGHGTSSPQVEVLLLQGWVAFCSLDGYLIDPRMEVAPPHPVMPSYQNAGEDIEITYVMYGIISTKLCNQNIYVT